MSHSHHSDAQRRRFLIQGSALGAVTALHSLGAWAAAQDTQPGKAKGKGTQFKPAPVLFIGHGSPMNAISTNAFTRSLNALGQKLPPPKALLVVSAHWLSPDVTAVNVAERPPTIHDFGGFPAELHAMEYPAPGSPQFAREAIRAVKGVKVVATREWGLDHGTWTVLHHLYPDAKIPVFQLSIDYAKGPEFHYQLGRELAALRQQGVMIIGSGNIVHNLRATQRGLPEAMRASQGWAQRFDDAFAAALAQRDDKRILDYTRLDAGANMAVPTPDHYWPMLYALGAAGRDEAAETLFTGFHSGTLSMRCFGFGV
jgi:4,5-DOPA dioxygenase extradiol